MPSGAVHISGQGGKLADLHLLIGRNEQIGFPSLRVRGHAQTTTNRRVGAIEEGIATGITAAPIDAKARLTVDGTSGSTVGITVDANLIGTENRYCIQVLAGKGIDKAEIRLAGIRPEDLVILKVLLVLPRILNDP